MMKIYSQTKLGTYEKRYSLEPFVAGYDWYSAADDDPRDYEIPDGFSVAESNSGKLAIYDPAGKHCDWRIGMPRRTLILHHSGEFTAIEANSATLA